jgi:predicted ATP-dependent endonuclease of OLD family
LALLEEEADDDGKAFEQPTLILACEEPELYQHPPQARYLATVLRSLQEAGSQVLLTTHSPYFVSGDTFEEIRLIRKLPEEDRSTVCATTFEEYANRIAAATGKKPDRPAAIEAKLQAALRPEAAELFFANKLVLVEGIEDRAYITTALILEGRWDTVRRRGLHILPADRKSNILQLLVIAGCFDISTFVIFDADGHVTKDEHRKQHECDNTHLMKALKTGLGPFPGAAVYESDYAIWSHDLETEIRNDLGPEAWTDFSNVARQAFDPAASLKKNPLMIAETLRLAWIGGKKPSTLIKLVEQLVKFAVA